MLCDAGRATADKPLVVAEGDVTSLAISSDGTTMVAGYRVMTRKSPSGGLLPRGGGVVLWDMMRPLRPALIRLGVAENDVTCVAISPDDKVLAAGCTDGRTGRLVLWDLRSTIGSRNSRFQRAGSAAWLSV